MKSDSNGCSVCTKGNEAYAIFKHGRKTFCQYDYRTHDGKLFSCVAPDLTDCRIKRDNWIKNQKRSF